MTPNRIQLRSPALAQSAWLLLYGTHRMVNISIEASHLERDYIVGAPLVGPRVVSLVIIVIKEVCEPPRLELRK